MQEETDGYSTNSCRLWLSSCYGCWSWLFCFLRLANNNQNNRSSGTIIRLTDQLRLLDQDMIRLQQKVNTVLELKEEHKLKDPNEKLEGTQEKTT